MLCQRFHSQIDQTSLEFPILISNIKKEIKKTTKHKKTINKNNFFVDPQNRQRILQDNQFVLSTLNVIIFLHKQLHGAAL